MINSLFGLKGKTALVTGSSRGIGFTLARGLARAGAQVVLNGRDNAGVQTAVRKLREEGLEVVGSVFDIANEHAVNRSVNSLQKKVGEIHILVNNAGMTLRAPLESFSLKDWQNIMDINLSGAFIVSKAVVSSMIHNKAGKIINICSMQSELGRPTIAAYAVSKGGLKMLTKSMATEWARYNIQVNGLGPGYFKTELTRSLVADESFSKWVCNRTPAGRWGDPEELVGAAIFLASSASGYVNGHILYVDGGMLACV